MKKAKKAVTLVRIRQVNTTSKKSTLLDASRDLPERRLHCRNGVRLPHEEATTLVLRLGAAVKLPAWCGGVVVVVVWWSCGGGGVTELLVGFCID